MNTFASLIDLSAVGGDAFQAAAAPERSGRMYGGQFLAQGLAAAMSTMEEGRDVHSLHAYFLRPGDVDSPIELDVERVRDGRSFSARVVRVMQHDKELFRMMMSFDSSTEMHSLVFIVSTSRKDRKRRGCPTTCCRRAGCGIRRSRNCGEQQWCELPASL